MLISMARARNIKPGFFLNEQLVELPFSTRLLFIGLWTIADREGRLEDKPRKIKMALFPADSIDVEIALSELNSSSFIIRYSVNNNQYIQIVNFNKHQNPHIKEQASIIPEYVMHQICTRHAPDINDVSMEVAGLIPDSLLPITDSLLLIPETGFPSKDLSPLSASTKKNGARLPEDWFLPKDWGEWALNERTDLDSEDIRKIADEFKDHWLANANQKNAKKSDWLAAWRNWIRKTDNKKSYKTPTERRNENTDKAIAEFLSSSNKTIEGEFKHA